MSEISRFLDCALDDKVIDRKTHDELGKYEKAFERSGVKSGAVDTGGYFTELNKPNDEVSTSEIEASEAPRLIRGFHDILITIGILIALAGLWRLVGPLAVIPAIVGLAEFFVKRQRLALPAFTLTIMLVISVWVTVSGLFSLKSGNETLVGAGVFLLEVLALSAFYWRYRVPVALAMLILSGFGLVFFVALSSFESNSLDVIVNLYPKSFGILGLVLAFGLFFVAMHFDLKDRHRTTRRSDVAFWLHLATAPLLLYSIFFLVFGGSGIWFTEDPNLREAITAICILTFMVLVGIVIDRRAFVTSGLISLGVALGIITEKTGIETSNITALVFLSVGIIVLFLGSGWQQLRRLLIGLLPQVISGRVPPAG